MKRVLYVYSGGDFNYPPLAAAFVIACLKKYDLPADAVDLCFFPDAGGLVSSGKYDFMVTGGMILDFVKVEKLFSKAKSLCPSITTVLGGPISACPLHLLQTLPIDYLVIGDVDPTFPLLYESLVSGGDISKVKGIAYRKGEKLLRTPMRSIGSLAGRFPDWSDIDLAYYMRHRSNDALGDYPLLTGMGCLGNCTFCRPGFQGYAERPVVDVIEEIKQVVEIHAISSISVINEMFYHRSEDIADFCVRYRAEGLTVPWSCSVRADVDPSIFPLMADAGNKMLFIGIESFDDNALKAMNKRVTTAMIRSVVTEARAAGINIMGGFMVGNLGDTPQTISKTVDFFIENNIYAGTVNPLMIYPGSRVYTVARESGLIPDELSYYRKLCNKNGDVGLFGPEYPNISPMDTDTLRHSTTRADFLFQSSSVSSFTPSGLDFARGIFQCYCCGKDSPLHNVYGFLFRETCRHCMAVNYIHLPTFLLKGRCPDFFLKGKRVLLCGSEENIKAIFNRFPEKMLGAKQLFYLCEAGLFTMNDSVCLRCDLADLGLYSFDIALLYGLFAPHKMAGFLARQGIASSIDITPPHYFRSICNAAYNNPEFIQYPYTFSQDITHLGGWVDAYIASCSEGHTQTAVVPFGQFAQFLSRGMDAPWHDKQYAGGKWVKYIAAEQKRFSTILIATPSSKAQQRLAQLLCAAGVEEHRILLLNQIPFPEETM